MPTATNCAAAAGAPIYRIHPAIGVARLGNADPDQYFIGPEIPGYGPTGDSPGTAAPPYKVNGLVKPQAARFRIFEYASVNGQLTPVREVNLATPGIAAISWTVHLVNRKSAFYEENGPAGETLPAGPLRNATVTDRGSLQSDFGPRTIGGTSQGPVEFRPGGSGGSYAELVVKGPGGITPLIDYLGQLRTDAEGRLILLGGQGKSSSNVNPPAELPHWSNNNNWFDDIADGPVTAIVTLSDGTQVPMDTAGYAWALVAPPDFAPRVSNAVTLYDVLYDMAVRSLTIPANNALYDDGGSLARLRQLNTLWQQFQQNASSTFEFGSFQPDYETEIWPILRTAVDYVYVTALVNFKHSSMLDSTLADPSSGAAKARQGVFTYIRPPQAAADNGTGPRTMPRLYGDNWYQGNQNFSFTFAQNGPGNPGGGGQSFPTPAHIPQYQRYLTLTPTQYGLLHAWSAGQFVPPPGIGTPPPEITPHGLDRAALENCVGGGFYPGIECSWQIRNPKLFIEPFRIDVQNALSQYLNQAGQPEGTPITAGHFSRQMAVPWQADFNDCSKALNLGWWPAQRPDDVFLNPTDTLNQRVPWARATTQWGNGNAASTHQDMVANWWKFGFVVEGTGGVFVESERAAQIP
jgi:hypothetical protein